MAFNTKNQIMINRYSPKEIKPRTRYANKGVLTIKPLYSGVCYFGAYVVAILQKYGIEYVSFSRFEYDLVYVVARDESFEALARAVFNGRTLFIRMDRIQKVPTIVWRSLFVERKNETVPIASWDYGRRVSSQSNTKVRRAKKTRWYEDALKRKIKKKNASNAERRETERELSRIQAAKKRDAKKRAAKKKVAKKKTGKKRK